MNRGLLPYKVILDNWRPWLSGGFTDSDSMVDALCVYNVPYEVKGTDASGPGDQGLVQYEAKRKGRRGPVDTDSRF
jgi:hypothetical protein